jgi:hypothetical protein
MLYMHMCILFYIVSNNRMHFYEILYIDVNEDLFLIRFIDNLYSFFNGLWYTGLMMARK